MAEPPPDAVYTKTPQGSDEVATRRHGLSMRVRQLLILVDGRRSVADLAKLVPAKDLAAHLPTLEAQGFVARADAIGAGTPAAARAAAQAAGAGAHVAQAAAAPHGPVAGAPQALVAGAPLGLFAGARLAPPALPDAGPPTVARVAAAATPAPQRRDLETLRRAVVRHLVDAIGPHADDMAVRVERCRSVDELRQILPSVAGLVEAIRGRAALAAFLQRVGPL